MKHVWWADQHGQPPTVYIVPRKTPRETLEPELYRRQQRERAMRKLQPNRPPPPPPPPPSPEGVVTSWWDAGTDALWWLQR